MKAALRLSQAPSAIDIHQTLVKKQKEIYVILSLLNENNIIGDFLQSGKIMFFGMQENKGIQKPIVLRTQVDKTNYSTKGITHNSN